MFAAAAAFYELKNAFLFLTPPNLFHTLAAKLRVWSNSIVASLGVCGARRVVFAVHFQYLATENAQAVSNLCREVR